MRFLVHISYILRFVVFVLSTTNEWRIQLSFSRWLSSVFKAILQNTIRNTVRKFQRYNFRLIKREKKLPRQICTWKSKYMVRPIKRRPVTVHATRLECHFGFIVLIFVIFALNLKYNSLKRCIRFHFTFQQNCLNFNCAIFSFTKCHWYRKCWYQQTRVANDDRIFPIISTGLRHFERFHENSVPFRHLIFAILQSPKNRIITIHPEL